MIKEIKSQLKQLKLSGIGSDLETFIEQSASNKWTTEEFLKNILDHELLSRTDNRFARLLSRSGMPISKSIDSFQMKLMPLKLQSQSKILLEGDFVKKKENVLAFGNPGSGKTHLLCAIAREQIKRDVKVIFKNCQMLLQELLRAKEEKRLDKTIRLINKNDILILDDIGYVNQTRAEMEVLFILLSQRYENASVMISSNTAFSGWDKIFGDKMMANAVIDRLIHHSVILDMNLPSFRTNKHKTK